MQDMAEANDETSSNEAMDGKELTDMSHSGRDFGSLSRSGRNYYLRRQRFSPRPIRVRRFRRRSWLIPADHWFKIMWDLLTICLSFLSAYNLHNSIRDRQFGHSPFLAFCETWFFIDILLNFVTEHKSSDGAVLRDGKSVWARYLTTWFAVDILSLLPWESVYVKPIVEMQKRRGFFKKVFFRTRAVIRVTRVLRGRHFRLFGKVARQTKHAGVGARRLLRLIIKYLPKYLLFFRHMKGALAVRTLRQVHWVHKVIKAFAAPKMKRDDDTESLTFVSDSEDWEEVVDDDDEDMDDEIVEVVDENVDDVDDNEDYFFFMDNVKEPLYKDDTPF